MTCIIALAHEGAVYMGADSQVTRGWGSKITLRRKVIVKGDLLVGVAGVPRVGQLFQHQFELPERTDQEDDEAYLVRMAEAFRGCLKNHECDIKGENFTATLIGYRGVIYDMDSNFSVDPIGDGLMARGTGDDLAIGAMAALEDVEPCERILRSLEIVGRFSAGVSGPYYVEVLDAQVHPPGRVDKVHEAARAVTDLYPYSADNLASSASMALAVLDLQKALNNGGAS